MSTPNGIPFPHRVVMAITNIECDYVCNCHDHPTREWDATPRKDGVGSLTQGATAMIHPTLRMWLSCPLRVVDIYIYIYIYIFIKLKGMHLDDLF